MKGNSSTGSPYMSPLEDVMGEDAEFKVPLEMTGEWSVRVTGLLQLGTGTQYCTLPILLSLLSCHIMYYIMFGLRFVLFFTNSKNDCMMGQQSVLLQLHRDIGWINLFQNSTIDESESQMEATHI